ncbi:MAG: carbohydrate kinase family protein [Candidatus Nanoarchaeia archaeon]
MYDVITFGSATVDAFAKTDIETISINHDGEKEEFIAYEAGSKILINELDFQIGGGGTNTAVAFARLGLKVGFAGILGSDTNAEHVKNTLAKENVDFIGAHAKGQTGYSMILDSCIDDRTILTFKGVNNRLQYSMLDKNNLQGKWFYFSSLVGESYNAFVKLTEYAKRKKINIAFNPSSYLAKKGKDFLKKPLKNTTLLVCNLEEAELIAGKHDIKTLCGKISKLGPQYVVVTNGSEGAYAYHDGILYYIPALKTKVTETTGAGDAFAAGFLGALISKNNIRYALRLGVANSSSVIRHIGAKNRLLTMKQAQREIKKVKGVKRLK